MQEKGVHSRDKACLVSTGSIITASATFPVPVFPERASLLAIDRPRLSETDFPGRKGSARGEDGAPRP